MDEYPPASLDHNVPLLVVSGLSGASTKPLLTDPDLKERSVLVRSDIPALDSREAKSILRYIQEADATSLPWNSNDASRKHRFKVKAIGREFLLPPRRARLPDDYELPPTPPVLHSPFSPLSPGSTLYPDGLIDARWLEKHQELIPSTCMCFYSLTSDPSLATLHDNRLKTDVNSVKNALSQSGFKCRLAVVILSDQAPGAMEAYQERLENIRRSTGLDPKTSLFVIPTRRPEADLESAVDHVLGAAFAQSCEYYRDLGRHARKKKGRGFAPQPTIPPTSGTSHTLSLQGWHVRYDFKTAVFAEFRQEMDVALRSYEQAYETLLGADVLETVPSWSPRFNDGRSLADIIAIRILRCLLWLGQSTAAVRKWQHHRYMIADLVDRVGRGTQSYGWQAWEARWAEVMAKLIEKTKYPELEPSTLELYRPPEKPLSAERLQPWELLHHPGYWYRLASRHALDRRKLAWAIPEDDRQAPDPSTVSKTLAKAYTAYDTYMCPEPYEEMPLKGRGTDHAQQILGYLNHATAEFHKRKQVRLAAEVVLECAKELEHMKAWNQVLEMLTPLWRNMVFRAEGRWDITESFSWTLRKAAVHSGRADLVVAIDWELLDSRFTRLPKWHYDISKSLDEVKPEEPPEVTLSDQHVTSCISSSFVFKHEEGRAGQTCPAQLAITSAAFPGSPPIVFHEILVTFEGSLRTLYLKHKPDPEKVPSGPRIALVTNVPLEDSEVAVDDQASEESDAESQSQTVACLQGFDDLTLFPGQTRVFQVNIPLREAGEASASSIRVTVAPKAFTLKYTMDIPGTTMSGRWYTPQGNKRAARVNSQAIKVLPRPPKMEVKFINVLKQYYAGEPIQIDVELNNEEDADAVTRLDVHLYGQEVPNFKARVVGESEESSTGAGEEARLDGLPVGTIEMSKTARATVLVDPIHRPTAYDLTVKAWYNLVSDPGTNIVQIVAFQINIVNPFEANYEMVPRLHHEAWPSLFDYESAQETSDEGSAVRPRGLAQRWCMITRFGSFATEDLQVLDLDLQVMSTQGAVTCTTTKGQILPPEGITMAPKTMEEAHFDLVAQKLGLDERTPATADFVFLIKWQRNADSSNTASTPNTTRFPLDTFYVTVSEPRVLGAVSYSTVASPSTSTSAPTTPAMPGASARNVPQVIILDITIENPSSHFLTFGLAMEPSDDFAFSGAKTTTLNVLPVARRTVTYRLLPLVRGAWIKPQLVVRDKYFQKVLKVIPTEGMKRDGDGFIIFVPNDEDDAEEEAEPEV